MGRIELEQYLLNTQIPEGLPQDEISKCFNDIKLHRGAIPKKLYRYRPINEKTLDALMYDKLIFSNPQYFNDPYDSLLYADYDKFLLYHSQTFTKESIAFLKNYTVQNQNLHPSMIICDNQEKNDVILNFFFNNSVDAIFEYCQQNQQHDFDNFVKYSELTKKSLQGRNRICCLSEEIDSLIMWAHYADSCKGFALEYELMDEYIEVMAQKGYYGGIFLVIYNEKRLEATEYLLYSHAVYTAFILGGKSKHKMPDILFNTHKPYLFKAKYWSYEKEWRISLFKEEHFNDNETFCIPLNPTGIYLGSEISPAYEEIIKNIAKDKKINLYKMKIDNKTPKYRLIKEKILIS